MDKKQYLKLKQETRNLKINNLNAIRQLFLELMLIGLGLYLSHSESLITWFVGQLLIFVCVWRQFSTLHSCAHDTFFKNKKLNLLVGHLCSVLSLLSFQDWKQSHLDHHIWVGDRDRDPSLNFPRSDQISSMNIKILNFCWKLHIPIFSFLVVLLKTVKPKINKNKKPTISLSFVFLVSSHLLLLIFLESIYFKLFLLPFFLYLFTSDFLIISQHNLLDCNKIDKKEFPLAVWDHKRVTKDLILAKFIGRHVLLNFDKHNLHHILPYISHYHLHKINEDSYNIGSKEHWLKWVKKVHSMPGYKVYTE